MSIRRRDVSRLSVGLLFAAPWIIGFFAITLYPSLASLYYSFTSFNTLQPPVWVGLQNFQQMFTSDPIFWTSVRNTLYFVAIGVPSTLILALSFALLLSQKRRFVGMYRALIYVPVVVPPVVTAIIWVWILNPENGLLNSGLAVLHVPQPGWLADPSWAKPALLIMSTWGFGQAMVIMLAGLQDVPEHLYEAAMIDGAGAVRRFWHVTLPMMSPVIFYTLVVNVIFSLQYFTQAFVAEGGGNNLGAPLNSTLLYSLYLYENAFSYFKMGYASAMAWILFLITVVATFLLFRFSRRFVYYEGGEQ
ncbi:MAG TPA: sugar ABC transporter permease [Chloroflexota bacterium]|nr:sugar ABC transporter permease [Chloroflexota bacterium]